MKWSLGRILETFPGTDGLTRVVNVKTASGIYKRSIHNLCPLPEETYHIDSNSKESPKSHQEDTRSSNTCFLGLTPSDATDREDKDGEPLAKRRRPKRPPNPLRGRFLPINHNWLDSPGLNARHSRLTSTSTSTSTNTSTSSNISHSTEQKRSSRITSSTALKLLMLTSLIVPLYGLSPQEPVQISPFETSPGLFFEILGQAQLINSEWNIITYYNLSSYWTELKGIRRCIESLHILCNSTTLRKYHCLETLYQFQHELRQIEETNEILQRGNGGSKSLQKRSPLDIIGNVANKLFGVLDSSYAEFIEGEIEKSRTNEDHIIHLLQNQTSILESTANIMKRREDAIHKQFEAIHSHMHAYGKLISDLQQKEEAARTFTALTTLTTLVLQGFHRTQDALLNVLTGVRHSKVSPLLITPMQLRAQIALIKEHIPSALTLPGSKEDGGWLIYNSMTARARMGDSYILCDIKIPLLLDRHFQLFKIIPVPIPSKEGLILIKPSSEYLVTSLSREQYYPLAQQEIDKCRQTHDNKYLCNQNHPIFNLKANASQCEMDLLNHRPSLSPHCQLRKITATDLWVQLHTSNNWLYHLNQATTFNVVCGQHVMSRTFKGSGILKLRPDCSIKQTTMIINGHGRFKSNILSAFIPQLNISHLLETHLSTTNKQILQMIPELHLKPNERDIEALTNKIRDMKQMQNLPNRMNAHNVHHYSISYVLLTLIICGLGYYILTKWKRSKGIKQQQAPPEYIRPPIPAERRTTANEDFVLHCNPRGQDVNSPESAYST